MREPDYARLLRFRTGLRRFVRWSDEQAAAAGVTPAQHQLLLAIRGSDEPNRAVMLQEQRVPDPDDRRVVHLRPTARGARVLRHLSAAHEEELRRIAPNLEALFGPR